MNVRPPDLFSVLAGPVMPLSAGSAAWIILFACSVLSPAHAQDAARAKAMMDNRQAALSVCVAYYTILQGCSFGEEALLAQRSISDFTTASQTAAVALGMSPADTAMRLEFNLAMQRQLIQGSCSRKEVLLSLIHI